jgi:hypothetical protein
MSRSYDPGQGTWITREPGMTDPPYLWSIEQLESRSDDMADIEEDQDEE